jgi:predicted nucleic acid-binding protein
LISFDTNILVYAADRDAGERHRIAADLIERSMRLGNCVQTLQSFCEFFAVVTRKCGVAPVTAAAFVDSWRAVLHVAASTVADLDDAMRAVPEHGLSFWDAMLWATARRAGARTLVSEDFQDGRSIEGVQIIDPFASRNAALIEDILPRRGDP